MSPAEFKDIAISQLGTVLTGRTPPNNDPEYFGGEVDFLTPTDMGEHRRLVQTDRSISKFGAQKLSRCLVPKGVAVSCIGWQMGKSILIDRPTITNQQINSIIIDDEIADRLFVYYALAARRKQIFVLGAGGSRTPIFNKGNFEKLTIKLPPLPMQKRIAAVFGSLDDKIERNQRMNETLEAMARAVFRDWFVDFGPTRRKAAGETDPTAILGGLLPDPTQATPLAALFPDSFRENGLPEGWELERLDRYLELAYGKALTKKDRLEGDYPVYGSGGISGTHNAPLANGPAIIVGRKGTVGSLYWEDRDFFAIDTVFYVVPKTRLSFLFYMLETLGLEYMNTDAAVPGLNRNNVYRLERAFGCEATRNAFADLADQFRAMIRNNEQENQTLAATRDLLLPKLMSGELRLTGAEGVV